MAYKGIDKTIGEVGSTAEVSGRVGSGITSKKRIGSF